MDHQKKTLFYDDFKYHYPPTVKIIIFIVFLLLFSLLTHQLTSGYFTFPSVLTFRLTIILVNLIFFLIVSQIYIDYKYIGTYPKSNQFLDKLTAKFVPKSKEPVENWNDLQQRLLLEAIPKTNFPKILFLGSSQTWGAGARQKSQSFVEQVASILSSSKKGAPYQFINGGISGISSSDVLYYYQKDWLSLRPKIVLINLGNNDSDSQTLAANLHEIITLNKGARIQTVLILEANSPEYQPFDSEKHEAIRQVALFEKVPLIEMHQLLKNQTNQGNLWWDNVHPTTFGHSLMADFISQSLKLIL